jgi:dTDP-4-dehydrorhamnose 3,5-epimerase
MTMLLTCANASLANSMQIRLFEVPGPIEITPQRFGDERGYFVETFNAARLQQAGIAEDAWVQDNQSYSAQSNTLRGLHYQLPPFAQAKLVRVLRGSIFDVAVDIRPNSQSYRSWIGVELTADRGNQLYVPAGFAHGFLTLEDECEIAYKVSAYFSNAHDRAIAWNDAALGIEWPIDQRAEPVLSIKDTKAPTLEQVRTELTWD